MYAMSSEGAQSISEERFVISECLSQLGLDRCATMAKKADVHHELINRFLAIIIKLAKEKNRQDVLEQLYFAGLVYG
jgi:hypothetical protein